MKPTKSLVLFVVLSTFLNCSSPKPYALQEESSVNVSHAYFYDWTTEIKIGSSGTNIFLANLTAPKEITIDSIYFKNLKGKLVPGRSMHYAHLVKMLPNSKGNKVLTLENFPFKLNSKECVVSYIEKGTTKYFKINNLKEKEGVHYLQEPPKEL